MASDSLTTALNENTAQENPYNKEQWPHMQFPDHRVTRIMRALVGADAIVSLFKAEEQHVEDGGDCQPLNGSIKSGLLHALDTCVSQAVEEMEHFEGMVIDWSKSS